MPARDEQEYEQRRQQIIDGALQVFSTKGFEEATNKDIARAAKIGSPGLIYHYFKDKSDLLRQVMEERASIWQLLNHPEDVMSKPPGEGLRIFAGAFTGMVNNRAAVSVIKLVLGESVRRPAVADMFARIGPGRGFAILTAYLSAQMEQGNLRRMDPGLAARCFVGPFIAYIMTREVFIMPDAKDLSPEVMAETAVALYLRGMQPEATD
jgi:AcrR family transcriptional regulator